MFQIQKNRETFLSFSYWEKKEAVLDLLAPFLGKGENFDVIHAYVSEAGEEVSEAYLLEVYDSALRAIGDTQAGEAEEMNRKFEAARKHVEAIKRQESGLSDSERATATALIDPVF